MIDVVRVHPADETASTMLIVKPEALDNGSWSWIFDGAEHGDKYVFEFASMSEADFNALPEWDGF